MNLRHLSFVLAVAILSAPAARAQTVTGAITGTIRDASGAAIPGASVSVVKEDTNAEFKTTTNNAGDYIAPVLPAGNYAVRVEAAGFRPSIATSSGAAAEPHSAPGFHARSGSGPAGG